MDNQTVRGICARLGLPAPHNLSKIAVGFTNEVYSLNERYILKVCARSENEEPFAREAALNRFFEHRLPVPKVILYDCSKTVINYDYMVCSRVPGTNLYNVWHSLTRSQRAALIEQLCDMLRLINATDLSALPAGTVPPLGNWKKYIAGKIEDDLSGCETAGTLSREFCAAIRRYVAEHINVLDQAKVALTYFDPHFDNLLVTDGRITGLLDLERTEIASIDYVLDLVWRMVCKPSKYMSEHAKQFVRDADYADLMDMYECAYPDLFRFDNLPARLNLYTIEHDLRDLRLWRELGLGAQRQTLAAGIADIVGSVVRT